MGIGLNLFFVSVFVFLMSLNLEALVNLLTVNAVVQLVLFVGVACLPFLKTGRVSFVDIAWPFGVALIGLQVLFYGDSQTVQQWIAGGVYLFIGLRMGIGALVMATKTGVIFKTEFPRYQYRRMIMAQQGVKHPELHLLAEILAQGFANMTVLALPGFLIATQSSETISVFEIAGLALWALAYLLESIADGQKLLFISRNPQGVCNIGLWRYSRHPNYFAEWLVWTGLVIAALPSWASLSSNLSVVSWLVLGGALLCASVMLFITLVFLTGAKPAEYYSVRKRPGYKIYQQQTNMFFPGFPKK